MITGLMALLLLLIALLAIPVTLIFQLSWQSSFQGQLQLRWLFGLVQVRLPVPQTKIASTESENLIQKKTTDHFKPPHRKKPNVYAAIRQKAFRQLIIRFIRDLWRAVQKKNLNLRVRIGLGDPADTGQLWAFVGPVSGILTNIQQASITIEPDFFDATFTLDSSGNIRIVPLQLIYLTVEFLLSPSLWHGIIKMRAVEK